MITFKHLRKVLEEMQASTPVESMIMVCKTCGYRAPFYLMLPARKYPGTVHCPKCDSDKTEREK